MEHNMDSDTKSMLTNIVSIVIAGAIIYYLFYKPAVQLQQYQFQQQIREQQYQQYQQPYRQQQQLEYKNDERWEVTRSKDGFISNIRVVRDAKTNTI